MLDTLRLARKAWPDLERYGLDSLIQAREIRVPDRSGERHRALYDAHVTAQLFLDIAATLDNVAQLEKIGGLVRTKPTPDADTLW